MSLTTVTGSKGMVTAPHYLAAEAGLAVLQDGGNAVEATVAVAACLAVVYPHMTGIGGDGFWVIHEPDGAVHGIHGCGGAAGSATLELYDGLDAVPFRGPLAANTVAGTISGWKAALESAGGFLPLSRLLRDAIAHAEAGVAVTAGHAAIAAAKGPELRVQPGAYAQTFEPEGRPLHEGDVLRQQVLAQSLRRLCEEGLGSFYTGALAADIAADLALLGSPVSGDDLAAHSATRPGPLTTRLRDCQLWNSAPPTQGFASLLILALFDRLAAEEHDGFDHVHGLVEATKQAFLIRDVHVGDPAYHDFDWQGLLSDSAALDELAARIDPAKALPWPQPPQWGDTCWFGAADNEGRVVSAIQSTYFEFGSGLVLPKTGITWQNRGSSFRLAERGWNALKPGRKPFHTLNPALARFDDGRVMAYGTMGGEGQPQTQAALFSRYARFGADLQAAINAPRWLLGRTWGEQSTTLKLEDGFDPALYQALVAAGHDVERVGPLTATMGHAGAIVRHADGRLEGATDPRSDGGVGAW
ncbi:MAG: gamma-glutamyltransferase [Novosphingobium sp. 28-62-57]|uniref:gamma-glutamyltransferase family protein n=1 Tax=unclassified Novosphingobium TaxID=2644732 RepID=UPI000BC81FEC|nr:MULTISPECIES: gamma-glutamyltransferase [unclassified Novosphingobium]OYW49952.1 MAG: gamma-glutamyltransferase [Novosphingobium sp. 12-62-10]OYZ12106.1 MAG: gamma-glutamyltransferase [Novosphingobium sp. 28-62-57]OZA31486.1 MAG: gamma-glutamyltransferase [Novosphingobium sp. 17-62-9]HQS70712.1 gamma-glutamyltransferase [Novosphingobium sp.]